MGWVARPRWAPPGACCARPLAWCDRVLWRARGHCVEAREYSSRYSTGSTCGSSSPTAAPATSIVLFGPRSCLGELRYFTREADLEALGGRQRWSLRRRGDGCRGPVARGKDRGPARGRGRNLRAPHRPRAPRRPAALPAVAQRPGQRPAVEAAGAARHARGVLRLGQGLVPRGARLARGPAARRGAVRGQVPHARRGVVGREDPRERRPGEDLALPGGAPVRHAAVCAPSRPRPPRGAPWRPVIGLRPVAALAARKE
ncbi:unnamed protein product, partial [Prorocentrum cordatum]